MMFMDVHRNPLLAEIGIPGHVAERCLNHKLKGVEGIYNRHDYFAERKEALGTLADYLKSAVAGSGFEFCTLWHLQKFTNCDVDW